MGEQGHNVIQHIPGERLLAVSVAEGNLVEITRTPGTGLSRRINGGEPTAFFAGTDAESVAVLDGLATSYRGPAAAPQAKPGRARGPLQYALVAGIAALGFGVPLSIYASRIQPGPTQFETVASSKPPVPVPDVIPAGDDYNASTASSLPMPTPNVSTGASRAERVPAKGTPPVVALPGAAPPPAQAAVEPQATRPNAIAIPVTARPSAPQAKASAVVPETVTSSVVHTTAPADVPANPNATIVDNLQARAADVQAKQSLANEEAKKRVETKGTATASDEVEKMKAALEMLERGDKLTPEAVAQLPHEIAQRLREAGAVASEEEMAQATKAAGGPEFKIVRLPSSTVDKFRDKDGVASIPETNSWAATGGNVRLPLPGGGEVKNAKELSDLFKVQM